ncbi:MAG TPA: OmpA family protein, partial [Chloroflexota bacterium]|nr:OmpA family protein [Chloroflexota bacterium]
ARYTDNTSVIFGTKYVFGPYGDTPRASGSLYGRVLLPAPVEWGDMSLRVDLYAQTGQWYSNNGNTILPNTKLPGYGLVNLRYDWTDMFGSNLSLGTFVKNLGDRVYYVGGLAQGVSLGSDAVTVGLPRMYGFELKYTFGGPSNEPEAAPAAYVPPPATPVALAPKNYLVFFDFNLSDLTSQAKSIVDQAAANAVSAKVTRIDVTGHTDTVGSDAYNMRLSRRRAEAVAAELEARGIPSGEIGIYAKGKRDLLVPTADGVREPQNRRVQIVYSDDPTS